MAGFGFGAAFWVGAAADGRTALNPLLDRWGRWPVVSLVQGVVCVCLLSCTCIYFMCVYVCGRCCVRDCAAFLVPVVARQVHI